MGLHLHNTLAVMLLVALDIYSCPLPHPQPTESDLEQKETTLISFWFVFLLLLFVFSSVELLFASDHGTTVQ